MLTNQKIFVYLQYKYDTIISSLPPNQVLGLLCSNLELVVNNLDLSFDTEDLRFICIYIPSLEHMCFFEELQLDYPDIKFIDIRKINMDIFNLLCSYGIINELYKNTITGISSDNMKEKIFEIVKFSLTYKDIDIKSFKDDLTESELSIYNYIKAKAVNNSINISISQAIEETGYSRPVFKNLIAKMKEYNVAEISNQGVKGTLIKFLI